jgi:hypothetical protein
VYIFRRSHNRTVIEFENQVRTKFVQLFNHNRPFFLSPARLGHGAKRDGGKKNWRHGSRERIPNPRCIATTQGRRSSRPVGLLFASLSLHSRATAEAVARLQCRNDFPCASLRRGTGKPTNCPLARALPLDPTMGRCPL